MTHSSNQQEQSKPGRSDRQSDPMRPYREAVQQNQNPLPQSKQLSDEWVDKYWARDTDK